MTPEQAKALALARARKRRAEATGGGAMPTDPSMPAMPPRADDPAYMGGAMQPAEPGWMDAGMDVVKSAGAGMARGAGHLIGLPGTLGDLAGMGATTGINAMFGTDLEAPQSALSGAAIEGYMSDATGGATDYRGQTTAGEYAGTIGEFVPGGALGGLKGLLKFAALPGAASEAAGQATEGSAFEPYARMAAALVTPWAASKAISPFAGANPERLKLADVLTKAGVKPTAGQKTGSVPLRKAEGSTSGGAVIADEQAEAFTSAALKSAGIDAKVATPEVLAEAEKRIGKVFDDAVDGVDVVPGPAEVTKISEAMDTFKQLAPRNTAPPLFGSLQREFVQSFRSGNPIPASTLKVWRSNLSKLTKSPDQATRDAAIDAMEATDDALEAGMVAAGRPEAVDQLKTARLEWRNLLALEDAAGRAGEAARLGILSPAALARAVSRQGKRSFATGKRGDLGELAAAGEGVLSPLPSVSAGGVRAIEGLLAGGAGAVGYGQFGVPGLAAALLPGMGKEAMMSRLAQALLGNQAMKPVNRGNALTLMPGASAGGTQ